MSNIKNISAENCYSTIKENKDAYLVDVRTPYEWKTFGRVNDESFDAQYIELTLINEEGDENTNFLDQFNSKTRPAVSPGNPPDGMHVGW